MESVKYTLIHHGLFNVYTSIVICMGKKNKEKLRQYLELNAILNCVLLKSHA